MVESKKINSFFSLSIQEPYFPLIQQRKKRIKARIHQGKYIQIQPGDWIQFLCSTPSFPPIFCLVKRKTLYPNFQEMLQTEGLSLCLPGILTLEKGEKIYYSFPKYKELVRAYPVVAFQIDFDSNPNF